MLWRDSEKNITRTSTRSTIAFIATVTRPVIITCLGAKTRSTSIRSPRRNLTENILWVAIHSIDKIHYFLRLLYRIRTVETNMESPVKRRVVIKLKRIGTISMKADTKWTTQSRTNGQSCRIRGTTTYRSTNTIPPRNESNDFSKIEFLN